MTTPRPEAASLEERVADALVAAVSVGWPGQRRPQLRAIARSTAKPLLAALAERDVVVTDTPTLARALDRWTKAQPGMRPLDDSNGAAMTLIAAIRETA
jgi:hypothetical protein